MGRFFNIGNDGFRKARNGEYMDKSLLIGYCDFLTNYVGEVVLVGINCDKKTKVHTCQIEHISNTKSNACLSAKQQDVLAYCKRTAHTAKEIFVHLGISTQAKHYAAYIDYLLQRNLLEDVTPERQRNKRYMTKK